MKIIKHFIPPVRGLLAAAIIGIVCLSGCNRTQPPIDTVDSAKTAQSTDAQEYPSKHEALVRALQAYLQDAPDASKSAGYYVDDDILFVCATDEAALQNYRSVLESLADENTVRYELREFSLAHLKSVMSSLQPRMSELSITSLGVVQKTNRVLVTISSKNLIEPIKAAAGEDAAALDFQIASISDA